MVKIPVSLENLEFERLDLHRHYVVIDCDFTVYLILNPVGEKPLSGTDVAVINIGSWQIDAWKFLVRDNFPNEAGFSAVLAWDKTLIQDSEQGRKRPRITESDVDIADSVSSLKGQPVNITGFSLDDGKSLKVSTLENEYVNIKPYENLPICKMSRYHTFKINDVVDDLLLSHVLFTDDSGNLHCMFEGYYSISSVGGSFVYHGRIITGSPVGVFEGGFQNLDFVFSVQDNIITGITLIENGATVNLVVNNNSSGRLIPFDTTTTLSELKVLL